MVTITNFVDLDRFYPDYTLFREEKILRLLCVASVRRVKNTLGLISAVKRVIDEGYAIRVDWFGDSLEDDYYQDCLQSVEKFHLQDVFYFHASMADIAGEYRKADLFCMPSLYEGFPNVLCEAMACGLPVIASNVSDNAYIMGKDNEEFLFDPCSVEDMAACIIRFQKLSLEKRLQIGRTNRESALQKFSRENFVSVPKWSGEKSVMRQMVWFRKYVKRLKPDAVLSFLAPFNMLSLVSLAGTGIPVYIASRSDPHYDAPNRWWRWVRDGIYHLADGISVQSDGNKEYFSKYLRKKVSVIYNPVFIRSDLVGKALETPKELVIVSVGRLNRVKNQVLLLEVFQEIHRLYPDYRLVIYGEGDYREVLERKIRDLQLGACVSLPGACADVLTRILPAEIFVMTSDYEGMSNALIEAMVLGLPVISTRVSGAVDIIRDGENGRLVDVRDAEGVKAALIEWLEHKEKAQACAREGIKLADRLQLKIIVQEWLRFMKMDIKNKERICKRF